MNNETVLLTGASSGIGRELARCFAADGSRLILVARTVSALETLARELRECHGIEVIVRAADLANPGAPAELHAAFKQSGLSVDVLINNAGFGAHGRMLELPLARQLDMVQVNVTALTHLTRLFLPDMVSRRSGGVLNVASTAAFQPGPGMAVYYATKAYVLSFTEALAEELRGTGVTATALCPGPTADTNFGVAAQFKGPDLLTKGALPAATVARFGHKAFRRSRCVAIPGVRNRLLTFAVRLAPRAVIRKAVRAINDLRSSEG
jgi:short-subunit dehydrogenase